MANKTTTLWEIARLFLKLGAASFGGPAAHVDMLQREAVVTWQLARAAIVDWQTLALAVWSAALLYRFPRLNTAWLVAGAGLLGAIRYALL